MNIEEKIKEKINKLLSLNKDFDKKKQNSSLIYHHISVTSGQNIHHIISLLSKEDLKQFNDEDLTFLGQLEDLFKEFFHNYDELSIETWFENVVIDHFSDELFYPRQFALIRDKLVPICHHFSLKFGPGYILNYNEPTDESYQASDHKQLLKHLKNYTTNNESEIKKIEERINVIMRKGLYLTKEQNERIKSQFDKIRGININDDELDIKPGDNLGSGGFGTVMRGTYLKTAEVVAVKEVRVDRISSNSTISFYVEIMTMNSIKHTNVLELVGAHIEYPFRIVTRFCAGKSLFDRIHKKGNQPLKDRDLTKIAYQVALGMEYLHSQSIVHRDLKTLNILLDAHNNACVADFGLSGRMKDKEQLFGGVGTPNYTAPEILARIHYNSQVDVYSYAIVLWEMLLGRVPFSDLPPSEIFDHVVRNNWRLPLPQESPKGLRKLITQAWSKNPKERPTFSQIVEMFRNGEIFFGGADESMDERRIDCAQIEKEKYCPPLNEEYLMSVLNLEQPENFDSVVKFVVEHMDDDLQQKMRENKILEKLIASPGKYYSSILLLASAVLNKDDTAEYQKILRKDDYKNEENSNVNSNSNNRGKALTLFDKALEEHSSDSLTAALTFATKMPEHMIPLITYSLGSIVNLLGDKDPFPDGIIFQLLTRFPKDSLKLHIPKISETLLHFPPSVVNSQTCFDSVSQLIKLCEDVLKQQNNDDLRSFAGFISLRYTVTANFVRCIINLLKNDANNIPVLIVNILEAMKYSDISDVLNELTKNVVNNYQTIFDELVQNEALLTILCSCLKEKQHLSAPLFLLFCIARRADSPPLLSNHELIPALLEMKCCTNQRLHIFAALTLSEEFCQKTIENNTMDGIVHLLSSSLTSDQQLVNSGVRLVLSMSTHESGCKILEKNDVFELFVQHFLSSSIDSNASLTIIRNAMKHNSDIPQIPLIASCLLQSLLYDMASTEKILDTLVALVKRAPMCVQTRDLQVYILRFTKQEKPLIVLQSLRFLKSVDVRKLAAIDVANSVLTAVDQILKKPEYAHPKIINAALATIRHLMGSVKIKAFLEQTKIVEYAQDVLEMVPIENEKIHTQMNEFIQVCKKYMKPSDIQSTPLGS